MAYLKRIVRLDLLTILVPFLGLMMAEPSRARPARHWGPPTGEKLKELKSKPRAWQHVKGVTSSAKTSQWHSKSKARVAKKATKKATRKPAKPAFIESVAMVDQAPKTAVPSNPPPVSMPTVEAPEEASSVAYIVALALLAVFALGASALIVYRQWRERTSVDAVPLTPVSKEAVFGSGKEIEAPPSGLEGLSVAYGASSLSA